MKAEVNPQTSHREPPAGEESSLTHSHLPLRLLLRLSQRYLMRHPWQVGLALLGVALGVAMLVAVALATTSARLAFQLSAEQVAGRTTHQVTAGPAGLDPFLAAELRALLAPYPGAAAAAVVETGVRVEGPHKESAPPLTLLGVEAGFAAAFRPGLLPVSPGADAGSDPSKAATEARPVRMTARVLGSLLGREGVVTLTPDDFRRGQIEGNLSDVVPPFPPPGGVMLSEETAQALHVGPGDTLPLKLGARIKPVLILATLSLADAAEREALSGLLLAELNTVQGWLDRPDSVDRIDLILPSDPGTAPPALEAQVKTLLPPGAQLTRPALRQQGLQQMTAAFEVNLQALSFLALIVGMFLIYNTITFSVVQRRALIGTLRCLGLTRKEIFWQVVLEALLIGSLGTLLGSVAGLALGRGLVGLVTQTINDLYFAVSVREVTITPSVFVQGALLGIVATTLTAMLPAREATHTPPRLALRRSSVEEQMRQLVPRATLLGLGLLLGTVILTVETLNRRDMPLELSFFTLLCGILGAASLTPILTRGAMAMLRPLMGRVLGLLGRMATRDIVAHLSRTSIAIAALMIAVSVTIGIGLMVGSFRQTVVEWLAYTLQADIYVSVPGPVNSRSELVIPVSLEQAMRTHAGVSRVRTHRRFTLETPQGPVELLGAEIPLATDRQGYRFLGEGPVEERTTRAWEGFDRGELLITEPLASRLHLGVGDRLTLPTAQGPAAFTVAGVYFDYASDQGMATLRQERMFELWQIEGVTAMGLQVEAGVDIEALVDGLRQAVPPGIVASIRSTRTLREASMQIFDRTFAITYVLQLLATGVAFIGILSALMALQLERARELAVLRATGLTPRQLWGLVLTQTGLMGVLAGLQAIPVGIGMAWLLVFVINARSFGWSMPLHLDAALCTQALLGAMLAALLAGLYPAWKMSRTPPALALREE